ncbi:MAG: uracil-DNA glycosylase [Chitinivibrionales bacterium]|nr:uracil-DNA glycosylase [Chitinivibrionales bacterium]
MKSLPAAALEFFSQRKELGENDFFLSPAFSRSSFLSTFQPPSPDKPVGKRLIPSQTARPPQKIAAPAALATAQPVSEKREALKQLFFGFRECRRCALGATRIKLVFGSGNAQAQIMIIGEAPGADEDQQGLPFVGKAGQLLTAMLASINLDRGTDVFITNVVKCRPPQNRNPETSEIVACSECLTKQIEIIRPKIIVLLGRIAAGTILNSTESISKLRTREHEYKGIPVMVTYHPAALLRNPDYKKPTWEDLQKFRIIFDELKE